MLVRWLMGDHFFFYFFKKIFSYFFIYLKFIFLFKFNLIALDFSDEIVAILLIDSKNIFLSIEKEFFAFLGITFS